MLLAAAVWVSAPVAAQIFSDSEARESAARNTNEIEDLKRALARVNQNAEKAVGEAEALRRQFGASQAKIQQLEARNRELQGALEEARHAADSAQSAAAAAAETARQLLEELRAQSARMAAAEAEAERLSAQIAEMAARDLRRDSRLAEQAALSAELARQIGDLGEANQCADLTDERALYENASALFQKRDYENARADFRRVLLCFPDGRFSEGARYWESAALFFLGRHSEAARTARALAADAPNSDKRPDAELILARALNAMGELTEARTVLENIIESDPASLAADKARQLLADLPPAGTDSSTETGAGVGVEGE